MNTLQPCPFCGGEATTQKIHTLTWDKRFGCETCRVQFGSAAAWNRRAAPQAPSGQQAEPTNEQAAHDEWWDSKNMSAEFGMMTMNQSRAAWWERARRAARFSCYLERDFGKAPCDQDCGKLRCMYPSERPAPAGQAVGERTPKDYAIEHAEYMAKTGEQLLEAINQHAEALMALEEADEPGDYLTVRAQQAEEILGEYMAHLRRDIYEFRKRRDRALASSQAERPAVKERNPSPKGMSDE